MATQVFNVALGRTAELYQRVDGNDPANSALIIVVINTSASDATLKDLDTLALILADGDTDEANNTNYARKVLTDSDLAALSPDDTNDRMDVDIPDQTWSAVAADGTPNGWTDVLVCYDPDTTSGDDTNIIPLTMHDFEVTPDGSDLTVQIAATGFFRAA